MKKLILTVSALTLVASMSLHAQDPKKEHKEGEKKEHKEHKEGEAKEHKGEHKGEHKENKEEKKADKPK